MSAPACPRLFQVEALRDGRLAGLERTSFERHLVNCTACAHEAEALDALSRALCAISPKEADELQVRRQRTHLLAAFDGRLVNQHGQRLRLRALATLSVTLALGVVLWLFWPVPPGPEIASASHTVIDADATARWSRHADLDRERVVLEHGSLRIRVRQVSGTPPLAVMLPDGELEDIGTTFSVTVTHGRTERVQVDEGSVLLKLRGRPRVVIRAGQTWQAPPRATPPLPSSEHPREPDRTQRPEQRTAAREHAPSPRAPAQQAPLVVKPQPSSAPSAGGVPEASEEFRAALAAFNAGQSYSAAQQFQRFAHSHPTDARAEDAAYLRVLALDRARDIEGRRAAARLYLQRYPTGFRRAEVERLAR